MWRKRRYRYTYFVSYRTPSGNAIGNAEIFTNVPITSMTNVREMEEALAKYQKIYPPKRPVITNWILLTKERLPWDADPLPSNATHVEPTTPPGNLN